MRGASLAPYAGIRRSNRSIIVKVKDVMTENPVCCHTDTNLRDVATLMLRHDCGEIPVVDKLTNKPIGVITDRDITCRCVAMGENPEDVMAADCMSRPVVTVTRETSIDACCSAMEKNQIRRVPVVDESGCCGMVSQADIARKTSERKTAEVVKKISNPSHASAPA
jgi:CBS domain-containing protein